MNLRCSYCQTPFTIGREQMLAALQSLQDENRHHYDAHCPRCRKANQVSRDRLEHFFPNWQEALAAEASQPQEAAPEPDEAAAKPTTKANKTKE
ncbi:MAG: hypothetical protein WA821_16315 [Anaerolineales bacterium]